MTAGLGGMSGAQAKAAVICGCVGVIAEVIVAAAAAAAVVVADVIVAVVVVACVIVDVDGFVSHFHCSQVSREALEKRHKQGWVLEVVDK